MHVKGDKGTGQGKDNGWKAFNEKRKLARRLAKEAKAMASGQAPTLCDQEALLPIAEQGIVANPEPVPNQEVVVVGGPQQVVGDDLRGMPVADRSVVDKGVVDTDLPLQCGDAIANGTSGSPVKGFRDACVGEHLSGEPFVWQGIFDVE